MKQVIFVVESDNNAIDDRYISKLLENRYNISDNDTKIKFIHMCGKARYRTQTVMNNIKRYTMLNKDGSNFVIYCFDTDRLDLNSVDKKDFENQLSFCQEKNYSLIRFNYDIEYVLLGKTIEKNKKKQESINFYKSKKIQIKEENLLKCDYNLNGCSNIYLVLDNILRKK